MLKCLKRASFVEIDGASRSRITRRSDGTPKQCKNYYGNEFWREFSSS